MTREARLQAYVALHTVDFAHVMRSSGDARSSFTPAVVRNEPQRDGAAIPFATTMDSTIYPAPRPGAAIKWKFC